MGSHPMRVPDCVCICVSRAHGTRLEEWGVSGPQLFFCSFPSEVGGVSGWTFNYLPLPFCHQSTLLPLGGTGWIGGKEQSCFELHSLSLPPLSNSARLPLSISVICFPLLTD